MTPNEPKKGLLILAGKPGAGGDDSPAPMSSPENEPDADDIMGDKGGGPAKGNCSGCVYYDGGMGQCKRYPQWVERMPEDWCGEFRAGPTYDSGGMSSAGQGQSNQMGGGAGMPMGGMQR